MNQTFVAQVDKSIGVSVTVPMQPAKASVAAEGILAQALSYCSHKMGLDGPQAAVERMRQGDGVACGYCLYSIAKQAAESIGTLDGNVRAVYTFQGDATPEDECFGEVAQGAPLVHLIVWAQRKTAALCSLVVALDRSLVRAYTSVVDIGQPSGLLDVQVIDDADVENRNGYGALLGSIHHRPIKVWHR
jgi:hypothetical protein